MVGVLLSRYGYGSRQLEEDLLRRRSLWPRSPRVFGASLSVAPICQTASGATVNRSKSPSCQLGSEFTANSVVAFRVSATDSVRR